MTEWRQSFRGGYLRFQSFCGAFCLFQVTLVITPIFQIEEMAKVTPYLDEPTSHPIFPSPRTPVCRICLEQELPMPPVDQRMIVACDCTGSVGHQHHHCLKQWVQRQVEKQQDRRAYCEICTSEIFYRSSDHPYWDFSRDKCKEMAKWYAATLVAQGLLLGAGIILQNKAEQKGSQLLAISAVVVMVILSLVLFMTILMMTKDAFLKEQTVIEKIYSLEESEKLGLRKKKGWHPPKIMGLLFTRSLKRISRDSTDKALPSLINNDIIMS